MKKNKIRIIASILFILVFLWLFIPKANANFFTDDESAKSDIEKTIDSDDGGIFEKIIAKMIGGIAETVLNLTTDEKLGVGFKKYDELIFAKDATDISPFTDTQWNLIMKWYKIMASIAGSLILIVVVITAYKIIISGNSIEKRNEAKDSLMRLFFGAVSIGVAPLFVRFLLFLNNNLVKMIVGYSNGGIDKLLGNEVITNVQTGNAIATSIVIALFAYLFFKLNVKFIIRQFTILVFTIFTPIVSIMWMINKRTIGAAIWFGQILINVFMQFIYAFLFLLYMQFLPQSGGWATSILWAMMILPLADVLQNMLQNLISRVAGINNDEMANRGIGMAGAMAHSIKAIAYQFKGSNPQNSNNTNIIGKMFNKEDGIGNNQITEIKTTKMETNNMKRTSINTTNNNDANNSNDIKDSIKQGTKNNVNINSGISTGKKILNTGKEIVNMGMYAAEGRNYKTGIDFSRNSINDSRREDYRKKENENNVVTNIQEQEKT